MNAIRSRSSQHAEPAAGFWYNSILMVLVSERPLTVLFKRGDASASCEMRFALNVDLTLYAAVCGFLTGEGGKLQTALVFLMSWNLYEVAILLHLNTLKALQDIGRASKLLVFALTGCLQVTNIMTYS